MQQRQGQQIPAAGMEQRQQQVGRIDMGNSPGHDFIHGVEQHRAVGNQTALGQPRRPAGMDDEIGVVERQPRAATG